VLDLDAYLARIGLRGRPSLAEVHRAHTTRIPFENLDPHRGVPVSLEPADIERKLVGARRGGYCFEHNLLLKSALEALGAEVEVLLARVRVGAPPGEVRGRSHVVLRVRDDGEVWHADVGFGLGGPLEPLPWGPGDEHEQSGWRFRIVEETDQLVLRTLRDGDWVDLYGLIPEPVPPIDVQMSNWFTSTYPRSPFVSGLMVCAHREDGVRVALSNWDDPALSVQTPTGTTDTRVRQADVPQVLAREFGLPGFTLGADGRLTLTDE
jgi:N-hydroxyarylamine O-acetyltransferase